MLYYCGVCRTDGNGLNVASESLRETLREDATRSSYICTWHRSSLHPLPILARLPFVAWLCHCISLIHDFIDAYSGNPEGDSTMLMMSLMREVFITRSLGVVWDKEGEAFTWGIDGNVHDFAQHLGLFYKGDRFVDCSCTGKYSDNTTTGILRAAWLQWNSYKHEENMQDKRKSSPYIPQSAMVSGWCQ